jgi:hypothetical protein
MAVRIWLEKHLHSSAPRVPGVLLEDAMGVGKMLQILACLALIITVHVIEQGGKHKRPPIIGKPQLSFVLQQPTTDMRGWFYSQPTLFRWRRKHPK